MKGTGKGNSPKLVGRPASLLAGLALKKRRTVIWAMTSCQMECYLTVCQCECDDGVFSYVIPHCGVYWEGRNRYVETVDSDRCDSLLVSFLFFGWSYERKTINR